MTKLDIPPEFSKYLLTISPSEIKVDKEDIFYRDKYNELINYIKIILTGSKESEVYNYIEPKGTLLLNVPLGTDVIDYVKLICSNYYLEFIELNNTEIFKTPYDFVKNLNNILNSFEKDKEEDKKRLILINQKQKYIKLFDEKSLLNTFFNNFQYNHTKINFIDKHLILIWLNYDYEEIKQNSEDLYEVFDLFIKIPLLNKMERDTVLRNFLEKNANITFDLNAIVNQTESWEVKDLNRLLKIGIFKHFLNAEINEVSNEITNVLMSLIESGEYIPTEILKESKKQEIHDMKQDSIPDTIIASNVNVIQDEITDQKAIINEIKNYSISEFMLNQLYENAASKNYNELLLIIDKLNKKEPIEDNDRKLLAKYPFILNDSPNIAQINLEKAKKRVDMMKQAFGK